MGTTPDAPRHASGAGPQRSRAPAAGSGEPLQVVWARVAREWGIDFEPPSPEVAEALPELQRAVQRIAGRLPQTQDRSWLAAALAAMVHSINADVLDEGNSNDTAGDDPAVRAEPATADGPVDVVAVAVVTSPLGVLVGRRQDGIPRWVFPGGRIEPGEDAARAAVRECAEETGVLVVAGREIGHRVHPATGRLVVYVACEPADPDTPDAATGPVGVASDDLAEVIWLVLSEAEVRMPDLFKPVRHHIGMRQQR